MKYFDTSVIILAILNDPRREKAIYELSSGGITSELGLIELVSYLSRNINDDPLPYAIKLLLTYNISVKGSISFSPSPLGNLLNVFYVAINISKEVKLKALDLLHISYALLLNVDKLITADKEFFKAKELLARNKIELRVID